MKTRSTILSLAALATFSVLALAPNQASAWGMREGSSFNSYRSMGNYSPSFRSRFRASESCSGEFAPTFRRGFASGSGQRGFGPMRQAQGYGSSQQFHGLEGHGQRGFGQSRRGHDSIEEVEAQTEQQDNPETAPAAFASKELQR